MNKYNLYSEGIRDDVKVKHERRIFSPAHHIAMLSERLNLIRRDIQFERADIINNGNAADKIIKIIDSYKFRNSMKEMDTLIARLRDMAEYMIHPEIMGLGWSSPSCDGDQSGFRYWVFRPGLTNERIQEILESCGVATEGIPVTAPYDCSGEYFSRPLWIHRSRHQKFGIVVTQYWGIDN